MRVTIRQIASETFNSSNQYKNLSGRTYPSVKQGKNDITIGKVRAGKNYGGKSIHLMIQLSMNTPFVGGQTKNDSSLVLFIAEALSSAFTFRGKAS